MRNTVSKFMVGVLAGLLLSSCGGGGGGDPEPSPVAPLAANVALGAEDPTLVAGPVSLVNATTEGAQVLQAIGATTDGGYTVAWRSAASALYLQHYDSGGAKEGGETQIPLPPESIAVLTDGSVVAAYQSSKLPFSHGIYIRRLDATGAQLLSETEVVSVQEPPTCGWRCMVSFFDLRVVALADGGFVVGSMAVGSSPIPMEPLAALSLRRYDAQGQLTGSAGVTGRALIYGITPDLRGGFTLATSSQTGTQSFNAITYYDAAMTAHSFEQQAGAGSRLLLPLAGGYVVFSANEAGATRQLLDSDGAPVGEAVAVPARPVAARELSDGSYVAIWAQGTSLAGQRFAASGAPLGGEFAIETGTATFQMVSLTGVGFALAWTAGADANQTDVYAQRFIATTESTKKACRDAAKARRLKGKERKAFIEDCTPQASSPGHPAGS